MSTIFQRNAIITGYVNSYCLVCDCYFDTEKDTIQHTDEGEHEKKLLAHPYLEKYGDNHIRKVNKGYFCEFCSLLLATAAKVSLHVQEKRHYNSKGTFLLRRSNGVVIAFDNVVISEAAWHGVADDTCALCNVEFDNEGIHRTEPAHLLNLVQNKVEFGANNGVYRKTDDSSFQCLTCNSVFALNKINDHFNDPGHKELYAKCQEEMKKYSELKPNDSAEKLMKTKVQKSEKATTVDNNQNNVKTDKKIVEKQESAHNCKELVLKGEEDKPDSDDETLTFAKENNITYNPGQTNAYCRLCEIRMPSALRCMKEHVNGKEHKSRIGKTVQPAQEKPKAITRRPLSKFIENMVLVENIFYRDTVINEKYCISQNSFMMITRAGEWLRCQGCEANFDEDNVELHVESPKHRKKLLETPVITSMSDTEFVREIRRDIFHCGFCNLVSSGMSALWAHVASGAHREAREAAAWRLRRHLPDVRRHRRDKEEAFMRLLMLGRIFE